MFIYLFSNRVFRNPLVSTTPSRASLSAVFSATSELVATETASVVVCENNEEGETKMSDDESGTDQSSSSETGDGLVKMNEQVRVLH